MNNLKIKKEMPNFDKFKFNKYMAMYPFNDTQAFNQWLNINNLDYDGFLTWFDKKIDASDIKEDCPWMDYLNNHYESNQNLLNKYSNPFCLFVDFIIEKASIDFKKQLNVMKVTNKNVNPKKLLEIFTHELTLSFANMISPTLTLEINVARHSNKLKGKTSKDRYKSYIQLLTKKCYIQELFNEYPVLLNRLIKKVELATNELLEIYSRLVSDYDDLCMTFNKLGSFKGFSKVKGDSHLNGRSVRICQFENLDLVYKPRNLQTDIVFQQLLSDLNISAYTSFKTIAVVGNKSYGWSEFITYKQCNNKQDLIKFYKNLGHYIMVLYLFNGADFHIENIISNAEYPMLIDLESIFHINPFDKEPFDFENHTVMDSSILPYKLKFSNQESFVDISALGYKSNQIFSDSIGENLGSKQDDICFERVKRKISEIKTFHPIKNKFHLSIREITKSLCEGFEDLYKFFTSNSSWIIKNDNFQQLCQLTYRCILRPTNIYTTLLQCSYHPDYLRNETDLILFLNQKLWESKVNERFDKELIYIEVNDIVKNDIPVFYFKPYYQPNTLNKRMVKNTKKSNLLSVIKTINARLSDTDLKLQQWLIEACMNTTEAKVINNGFQVKSDVIDGSFIDNYINTISTNLNSISINSSNKISFKDYKYLGREQCTIINQAPLELFNGDLGTLLYLIYYSHIYKKDELKKTTLSTLDAAIKNYENFSFDSIGGYIGVGGVLYAFTKIYQVTNDQKIITVVKSIVSKIENNINHNKHFDVLYGAAGALLSLLTAYECFKDQKILSTSIKCGKHLINKFKESDIGGGWVSKHENGVILGGFSHGVSGIAYALAKLSKISNQSVFATYAEKAIEYEDVLFDPTTKNYLDRRNHGNDDEKHSDIIAWCNGLVGIALTRIDILVNNYIPNRNIQFKNEIKRNLNKILAKGIGNNHSLCHGDASALEYLYQVSNHFPNIFSKTDFDKSMKEIVINLNQSKQKNGVKFDLFSPGLMLGSLGLSYQLMRFKNPQVIGNLLLLN